MGYDVTCEIPDRAIARSYHLSSVSSLAVMRVKVSKRRKMGQSGPDPSQFLLCETIIIAEYDTLLLNVQKCIGVVIHSLQKVIVGHFDEFLGRVNIGFEEILLKVNDRVDSEK